MITLDGDSLNVTFPDLGDDARLSIGFQRTLRIPDDGRDWPLPPGFGRFPLRHADDFAERLAPAMAARGGVMMPMHGSEAMWVSFNAWSQPMALKIAAGKINALTGARWSPALSDDPQDYMVVPGQPWLDGFCVEKGVIRQFVAERLGEGFSAEEQITGEAEFGGLQILAYPMKAERWAALKREREAERVRFQVMPMPMMAQAAPPPAAARAPAAMGLAAGGRMKQEIYKDRFGLAAWDQSRSSRCFVHLLAAQDWQALTGEAPPTQPPTAKDYSAAGLPWFDWYAPGEKAVGGSGVLASLKSWAQVWQTKGKPAPDNAAPQVVKVVNIGPAKAPRTSNVVREF